MKKILLLISILLLTGCSQQIDEETLKQDIIDELKEEMVFNIDDVNNHLIELSAEVKQCSVTIIATLSDGSETIGSGVVYQKDGDNYYVLTNNHVIRDATSLEALAYNGTYYQLTVIKQDQEVDLASLTFATMTDIEVCEIKQVTYEVGELVLAVGSPISVEYANSVTLGVISNIDEMIQHDAAINIGSSGGPLFNMNGELIGLNTTKLNTTYSGNTKVFVEGMGFGITLDEIINFIS